MIASNKGKGGGFIGHCRLQAGYPGGVLVHDRLDLFLTLSMIS